MTIHDIPVLFFPFARPEYAKQTFDAIKKAQPKKFYFYCDKAREGNEEELKNNNVIRDYINEVDWDCDLKTWFRDENIGVYTSILNAIDWFFENEEFGIVLEEDCLPSLAFFDFCRQLLPKYKDDQRVWLISGNNFIEDYNPNGYDYFFNHLPYIWGWATWRNRWQKVSRDRLPYEKIKEYRLYNQIYAVPAAARQALKFTEKIVNIQSWDYHFTITMKCHGGLGVIPKVNLVSNIGLLGANNQGEQSFFHNRPLPTFHKYVIINPPPFVVSDYGYSKYWYDSFYLKKTRPLYRIKSKLLRLLKKWK